MQILKHKEEHLYVLALLGYCMKMISNLRSNSLSLQDMQPD